MQVIGLVTKKLVVVYISFIDSNLILLPLSYYIYIYIYEFVNVFTLFLFFSMNTLTINTKNL